MRTKTKRAFSLFLLLFGVLAGTTTTSAQIVPANSFVASSPSPLSSYSQPTPASIPGSLGGYNLGYIVVGETVTFNVNIPSAASYLVRFAVNSPNYSGSTIHLESPPGTVVGGEVTIPNTGGWGTPYVLVQETISLPAGAAVPLKLCFEQGGFNFAGMSLTPVLHSIALSWQDNVNPAGTKYNVLRATAPSCSASTYTTIASAISVLSYTDTGVVTGASYCYKIQALLNGLTSDIPFLLVTLHEQ